MKERIFRIKCCDSRCDSQENDRCFGMSRDCLSRCTQCEVKEITEDWTCTECGRKFGKFDEYYEWVEAPGIEPDETTVPLVVVIRLLCEDCYKKKGNEANSL